MNARMNIPLFSTKHTHAYIVEGQKSEALKQANAFAKKLQCKETDIAESHPANTCSCVSCKTFASGNHPDIIYISPAKTKSIGVEDIRSQVVIPAGIKPYSSNHKIYIITNATLLTPAAQNALLKTLEEPPPYGVFLLLTESAAGLLPTVLSRCTTVKIPPLPLDVSISERLAEAEFATLHAMTVDMLIQIENAIHSNDLFMLLNIALKLSDNKNDIPTLLEVFTLFYRDIATYKATKHVAQKNIIETISSISSKHNINPVSRVDAIFNASLRLKSNTNLLLNMEVMLFDFWENLNTNRR